MENRTRKYMDKICEKIDKDSQEGLDLYLGTIRQEKHYFRKTGPGGREYDVIQWENPHGAF